MFRAFLFFVFLFFVALGFSWFADRPGTVVLTWDWLNREIEVSLVFAVSLLGFVIFFSVLVWRFLVLVFRSPKMLGEWHASRRRTRGYEALSSGLIAVGSGDLSSAKRLTKRAGILGDAPLLEVLTAQTSLLSGDSDDLRSRYESMLENDSLRLYGLRGLHDEAVRRGDSDAIFYFCEQAYNFAPRVSWATTSYIGALGLRGRWSDALAVLENGRTNGIFQKNDYRRKKAVLLTASALSLENSAPDEARVFASKAYKLDSSLIPCALVNARLLSRTGNERRAERILRSCWELSPHPDIIQSYIHLRPGTSAKERLVRTQKLCGTRVDDTESLYAIADAALDASDYERSREILTTLLNEQSPTRRVFLLMADYEEVAGDSGKVREWLSRAVTAPLDSAWIADGIVSPDWLPLSPVTGELDAFEWRVPDSSGYDSPFIEHDSVASPDASTSVDILESPDSSPDDSSSDESPPEKSSPEEFLSEESPPPNESPPKKSTSKKKKSGRKKKSSHPKKSVEYILDSDANLGRLPDDPGVDSVNSAPKSA